MIHVLRLLLLATAAFAVPFPILAVNSTADTSNLKTWWHSTGEINTETPVSDNNVRQSHVYAVQVATLAAGSTCFLNSSIFYDSFAYETIPGNGMGLSNTNGNGTTMAWSSFLYASTVVVKISRNSAAVGNYTIRPTNLNFASRTYGGDAYITVPYDPRGYRFSVEFADNLQTIPGPNEQSPIDALLIFASPMEDQSLIPSNSSSLVVQQGLISGPDTTTASAVVFEPGVYYCTGYNRMSLSSSVTWVYFAPGAYVKCAVAFSNTGSAVTATGHGILSGEQYVWYANPAANYTEGNNNDGLRMWTGQTGTVHQTFTVNGPTINAPPFNSMDWNGDLNLMTTIAQDYKQVGSFYGQTDGLEFYPGSYGQDIFYHVNDDTIKTYYSNVYITDVVVWKLATAPIVQFGWASRELSNITVNNVSVIHQSYNSALDNPGLIGADNAYSASTTGISSNHSTSNVSNTMQDVVWSNFRAEGPSACLFRINPLQNLKNIQIINAWIEEFAPSGLNTTESELPVFYDAITGVQVEVSNFTVDLTVGSSHITAANANTTGQIDVASAYAADVSYD